MFHVFSIALDCRLCIGQFHLDSNQLLFVHQIPLTISDPTALLLLLGRNKYQENIKESTSSERIQINNLHSYSCIVSGAGLEYINIPLCAPSD
jgi:hypothetical protein